MTQSRFISLTSYCLVEFMFEQLDSMNYLTDDVTLLHNKKNDIFQIFNTDASYNSTRNIQDLSATSVSDNKIVYLDSEKIPNYLDYDPDMEVTELTGYAVIYDKVRFHFVTGFDFEGFVALLLSIRNKQNDGKQHIFANILLTPDTISSLINLNPKPLFLSDTTFDRYIDIKIPSIKNINNDYITAPVQSETFAAAITPNGNGGSTGFVTNAPITISLSECSRKTSLPTDAGVKYDVFDIAESYVTSVSQTNEFDSVGAYVGESLNGDFIEYYLTFNSGFPEELISILNKRNPSDDWIIIHQLSVFEQVGSAFINTNRHVTFQESNWDEPLMFRPILKYAGSAVSASIDILCRLTNRRNGEQIIREASSIITSPKKYGKNLTTIPLSDEPQSHKIYNKIIKKNFESTNLFIEPTFAPGYDNTEASQSAQLASSIEYVPVFISNNNISLSNNSGYLQLNDNADEIIFGPGRLRFILSPFDNSIKLKLFNIVNKKAIPLDLNVNSARYQIVFETDTGKIAISNANSDKLENLSTGVILFEISKKQSEEIYKSSKQTVYLTSVSQDGKETLMYSGEWRKSEQQADVDEAIAKAKSESDAVQSRDARIAELEKKLTETESANNALKLEFGSNAVVKKIAQPSIVNRMRVRKPKLIKTNVSNAGASSTPTTSFSTEVAKSTPPTTNPIDEVNQQLSQVVANVVKKLRR